MYGIVYNSEETFLQILHSASLFTWIENSALLFFPRKVGSVSASLAAQFAPFA